MSQHVQRAERDYSIFYILFVAVLAIILIYFYSLPRSVTVKTIPEQAKIYLGDDVVCETSPCDINLSIWPKTIAVDAPNYHSQRVRVLTQEHFFKGHQNIDITLKPIIRPLPQKLTPPLDEKSEPSNPNITDKKDEPPKLVIVKPSKRKAVLPTSVQPKLPLECYETPTERRGLKTREPIICYYEDDAKVTADENGMCYAYYSVERSGRVGNIEELNCNHPHLTQRAKAAFMARIYLPAYSNGRPVSRIIEGKIKYGSTLSYSLDDGYKLKRTNLPLDPQVSENTINRDSRVTSCRAPKPFHNMQRSGHCQFEFDLTKTGQIIKVRQTKCTHEELREPALNSLKACLFRPAMSDGIVVDRPYMRHQIDVNVHNERGERIPPHASFGERVINKPYFIYDE